ncbi:MAG: N-6 DNA methylase [Acidobacteriota bacterium]
MLDTDTKRRIDTARDILVGKVPDPKSQVEQITIALIYKFMDDMDAHAEELGGNRKFFAGDFARYGWAKLMRAGLGGQEVLNLYAEAIAKMPENPGIPLLFRNIFRNAYLPYRDPETLKSFLKIIDDFTYDHSERLGDAFEYLLSVLGSQGDAGQFRTPRHIIDFIVDIVDPKKDETILDPACGTAGFLISAYKHILRGNSDDQGRSKLTPDEKGRLAKNIRGYDISPDMVRLSLVNLYLHGFTDPHIDEYDTLTSEDKWNETVDVIFANPPFMSPKGGIKPHRRFSVQSKRSEVLFVDYIAEHLSPTGRAGIIVPEGIIFQSQGAYTELRKMLVEKYLVAVISLPAGVFNPYSGVKTSVLILDKPLARQSETIGFFKVENDGFGLGAQRREIGKNDLPPVKVEVDAYLAALRNHLPIVETKPTHGLIVPKAKIAAIGEYNLSGARYREGIAGLTAFPLVKIEDLFSKISNGVNVTQVDEKSRYRVSRIQTIADGSVNLEKTKFTNDEVNPESFLHSGDILLSHINSFDHLGKAAIFLGNDSDVIHGINLIRLVPDTSRIDPRYVIRIFKTRRFLDTVKSFAQKAVNQASVKTSDLREIQIPLPPLEVQREIVAEIEGYQKVIDGARAVLDNYRPHIPIHPDWPRVPIEDLVADEPHSMKAGPFGSALKKEFYVPTGYKVYGQEQVIRGDAKFGSYYVDEQKYRELESCKIKAGDVLISLVGTYGKTLIVPDVHELGIINPRLLKLTLCAKKMIPRFFVAAFAQESVMSQVQHMSYGGTMDILSLKVLKNLRLPTPPIATQQTIVAEIEAEQALVNGNRELITRFEKKIQATLARVWGEHESASAEA